jgi:hypothetical protein
MSDQPSDSPLHPIVPPPLPAHNPHPQNTFEGLRDAVRAGLHMAHTVQARAMQAEFEHAVIVQSLLHVLLEKGIVAREELDTVYPQMQHALAELRTAQHGAGPRMTQPLEGYPEPTGLDCAAHHPTCEAACCTSFSVVLTPEEAASGKYMWDVAFPYRLLTNAAGTCVYLDEDKRRCTIWADRPLVCRSYDCRTDDRIWSDYPTRNLSLAAMEAKARAAAARRAPPQP